MSYDYGLLKAPLFNISRYTYNNTQNNNFKDFTILVDDTVDDSVNQSKINLIPRNYG